ncbi:hypothetical protein RRF57_008522 [Xylaria bambusicola]|uniref:Condensation domain-containing protein n=1 Tax=Xylaria bambusicola TaxID=326684 RepID=A0AAN7UTM2_9PEZI
MAFHSYSRVRNRDTLWLAVSHALVDGFSIPLIGINLCRAINGHEIGCEALSYSNYAAHLHSISSRQANYWSTYLRDVVPSLFPQLNSSPAGHLHSETRQIDSERARKFCGAHGFTISNIFQVAWAPILRYYANTDDICSGYLTSGRDIPVHGIENAVGLFINMLKCRLQLDNSSPTLWILQRNENSFVRSLEHQHCPLAQMQIDSGFQHGSLLFNSIISYQVVTATATHNLDWDDMLDRLVWNLLIYAIPQR